MDIRRGRCDIMKTKVLRVTVYLSASLTHSKSQDQKHGPHIGRVGQDLKGGKEGEDNEERDDNGIDIPQRETDTIDSSGGAIARREEVN